MRRFHRKAQGSVVVTCRPDINLCSSFTRVNNKLTALIVRDEATKFSSFVQRNEGTEAPKLKSSSHPDTATSTPIPNTLSRCTSGRIMIRSATTMPYTIERTVATTSSTVHCLNLGPLDSTFPPWFALQFNENSLQALRYLRWRGNRTGSR